MGAPCRPYTSKNGSNEPFCRGCFDNCQKALSKKSGSTSTLFWGVISSSKGSLKGFAWPPTFKAFISTVPIFGSLLMGKKKKIIQDVNVMLMLSASRLTTFWVVNSCIWMPSATMYKNESKLLERKGSSSQMLCPSSLHGTYKSSLLPSITI